MDNNCAFKFNETVIKVVKVNDKWELITDKSKEQYDIIISTPSYNYTQQIFCEYLTKEEENLLNSVEYTSAKTLLIVSKKKFSNFYWINIGDSSIPFGGIIEHTNMIDKSNYNGKNIIYISNYMYENDRLYKLSKEELLQEYLPYLKKINCDFDVGDIEKLELYEEKYAQPVIETEYSRRILNNKLRASGLYVASMPQIYPEDRGMNYAIKLGYSVAEEILKEKKC